jgi:hypothetical protein
MCRRKVDMCSRIWRKNNAYRHEMVGGGGIYGDKHSEKGERDKTHVR